MDPSHLWAHSPMPMPLPRRTVELVLLDDEGILPLGMVKPVSPCPSQASGSPQDALPPRSETLIPVSLEPVVVPQKKKRKTRHLEPELD